MKKILAVLLFFSSCFSIVYAQPKIQKSESLGSPVNPSYYKVLLLKNGNTALINCDGVGTFDVFLYGKDRKQLARQSVKNLEWDADDLRNTSFDGTYEINGEIVVFLQQQEKKRTVLYRMRINGETGKMIKDEAIAETRYTNFAFKMHNARATFNVAKDPASDYYSVVYYDNLTEEDEHAI